MIKRNLRPYILVIFALLLIIAAIILFTRKGETLLPFETIEMAELPSTGYEYQGEKPSLVVLSKKGDINQLGNTVSTNSQSKLRDLDFGEYFVLVVYQGRKATTLYGVEIQRITKQRNTIHIFAHFTERDPSMGAGALITSPYHIVKISRQGLKGKMEFILYADDKEVTRQAYTMP